MPRTEAKPTLMHTFDIREAFTSWLYVGTRTRGTWPRKTNGFARLVFGFALPLTLVLAFTMAMVTATLEGSQLFSFFSHPFLLRCPAISVHLLFALSLSTISFSPTVLSIFASFNRIQDGCFRSYDWFSLGSRRHPRWCRDVHRFWPVGLVLHYLQEDAWPRFVWVPCWGNLSSSIRLRHQESSPTLKLFCSSSIICLIYQPPGPRPLQNKPFNVPFIGLKGCQRDHLKHQCRAFENSPAGQPCLMAWWTWQVLHQVWPITKRVIGPTLLNFRESPFKGDPHCHVNVWWTI